MKFQVTTLILLLSFVAAGQKRSIKDKFSIDSSNHKAYYQQAQALIQLNDPDSSFEATHLLRALLFYDTTQYSMNLFAPLLDKVENTNRAFYQTSLKGHWKFEWSGSNWGTAQTSKEVSRTIVITDKEAIFYSGDTVKRRTLYSLLNRHPFGLVETRNSVSRLMTVNFFHLVFADTNEEWTVSFYKKGDFVPYLGQTQTTAMLINQMPNCVCGCPEEVYNKVVDNSIVGRQ